MNSIFNSKVMPKVVSRKAEMARRAKSDEMLLIFIREMRLAAQENDRRAKQA